MLKQAFNTFTGVAALCRTRQFYCCLLHFYVYIVRARSAEHLCH
jgi:hypothetical protein